MNVFAYCARSFAKSARKVAGVEPVTCPPVDSDSFDLAQLNNRDLIYFDLHGDPGGSEWYETMKQGPFTVRVSALTAGKLSQANLAGAVVFATNCYLGDPGNPMRQALVTAGAGWIIGGAGKNFGSASGVAGAGLLGKWTRLWLKKGKGVDEAVRLAKRRVALAKTFAGYRSDKSAMRAADDALAFRVWRGS